MGFTDGSAGLHISAPYHRPTTAGWVTTTVEALEYAYAIGCLVDVTDRGDSGALLQARDLLTDAPSHGLSALNMAFRLLLPSEEHLRIERIEHTQSFTLSFAGVKVVIEAIMAIFDPHVRATREETLRHTKVMNRLEEEQALTSMVGSRFELLSNAFQNPDSNYHALARKQFSSGYDKGFDELVAREFDRAMTILSGNEIRAIDERDTA